MEMRNQLVEIVPAGS